MTRSPILALLFAALAASLPAAPVVVDDFEGGAFSIDWDDTTGATITEGAGADGSAGFVAIAPASGPLGALFDGGASDFSIDFFTRIQETGSRQLTLMVGLSGGVQTGSAAINIRHQGNAWQAFDGAWQTINLPAMTAGSWYRARLTCRGWGSTGASYDLELSDAEGTTFTSSATGLAFYQTGNPNSLPAAWFSFNTTFGGNPGFDVDNVNVETDDAPPVDDPNISLDTANPFAGIVLDPNPDPVGVSIALENTGVANTLTIADTTAIIGDTAANYAIATPLPLDIAPGATALLELRFDDAGTVGTFAAMLAIHSNDASNPSIVVPLSVLVPSADGNQLGNGDFEEDDMRLTKWTTSSVPELEAFPAMPGIAPGSATAASLPAGGDLSQGVVSANDWYADFYFRLQDTSSRALNLAFAIPGGGQINLRYQGTTLGAENTWNLFTEADLWGDPVALPAVLPDETYFMRIVGTGFESGSPTYDLLLSEPGEIVLDHRVEGLTRFRTGNLPSAGPTSILFTAEFGTNPGFQVDDVRFINGTPPEDFPFEIIGVEYDEILSEATVTWSAEPGVEYFVYASSDLETWTEISDHSAQNAIESVTESNVTDPERFYRVQDFPAP